MAASLGSSDGTQILHCWITEALGLSPSPLEPLCAHTLCRLGLSSTLRPCCGGVGEVSFQLELGLPHRARKGVSVPSHLQTLLDSTASWEPHSKWLGIDVLPV